MPSTLVYTVITIAATGLCAFAGDSDIRFRNVAEAAGIDFVLDNYATPEKHMIEMMTGGVAKNAGVVNALEQKIGMPIVVLPEAQVTGAIGAALLAQTK